MRLDVVGKNLCFFMCFGRMRKACKECVYFGCFIRLM